MVMTSAIGQAMVTSLNRHNGQAEQPNELYDLAVDKFATIEQLNSCDAVQLLGGYLRGKPSAVILKNHNGFALLVVRVDGLQSYITEPFLIGYISPQGRQQADTCTLKLFNLWHRRQQVRISNLENEGKL